MESATSPEFFPPLDRPVDRVDAMTRWMNSFPHRHVGPNEGVESALPMAGGPPIARLKAAPAASRYLFRLLLVVPGRGRVHTAPAFGRSVLSAGLGGRHHRCGFAWVPFSSSVDAWLSALWLSLGSFLLLPCLAAVLFSLCPHFPHASDLHLGSCLGLVLLVTASLLSLCAGSGLFSLFSLFFFDSRLGSSKLAAVAYRFPHDLLAGSGHGGLGFTTALFPPFPFPPLVQLWTGRRGFDLFELWLSGYRLRR
jgi:hypothetical protein